MPNLLYLPGLENDMDKLNVSDNKPEAEGADSEEEPTVIEEANIVADANDSDAEANESTD